MHGQRNIKKSLCHIIAFKRNCMLPVKGLRSCEITVSATISDVGLILAQVF